MLRIVIIYGSLSIKGFLTTLHSLLLPRYQSSLVQVGRKLSPKTLQQVSDKLSLSNNRLDGAYYTFVGLHESGEPVSTEAINTVIAGSAFR